MIPIAKALGIIVLASSPGWLAALLGLLRLGAVISPIEIAAGFVVLALGAVNRADTFVRLVVAHLVVCCHDWFLLREAVGVYASGLLGV